MIKKFSFLYLAIFISSQALSLVHMSQHDYKPHKHDNVVCDIYLFSEQSKCSDNFAGLNTYPILFSPLLIKQNKKAPFNKPLRNQIQTRAPPVFA